LLGLVAMKVAILRWFLLFLALVCAFGTPQEPDRDTRIRHAAPAIHLLWTVP